MDETNNDQSKNISPGNNHGVIYICFSFSMTWQLLKLAVYLAFRVKVAPATLLHFLH